MRKLLYTLFIFSAYMAKAQDAVSVATDLSLLRSITERQRFTVIGQTVQFQYHFTPKESGYAWLSYYSPGNYRNVLTATAKDPSTTPALVNYTIASQLRFRQVSLGWKHYFTGSYNTDEPFAVYGTAGFGLLVSRIENTYEQAIDTALYLTPAIAKAGDADFRRLSFDLALGSELKLGSGLYFYAELRTWLQASSNPSPYLLDKHTPQVAILNGGIRILFD